MDQRAKYLVQILEKIGSPLMRSIISVCEDMPAEDAAKRIAELLGKSVELSIELAEIADLTSSKNDSVRVALTGLSSVLVAQAHTTSKNTPSESDLKRISSALQAVLTFSENFTPDEDNTARLENLEADGAFGDNAQITLQYIHAFLPVVHAIGAFSFGQSEQKLIMDVSSKITARGASLRENLLGALPENEEKTADLALSKTLAIIYAACHVEQTKRLSQNKDAESDLSGGIEKIWKNFDLQVSMLSTLAQSILPNRGATPAPIIEAPKETLPPAVEAQPKVSPAAAEATKPKTQSANPMSMFAKPKTGPADSPAVDKEPPAPAAEPEITKETNEESESSSDDGASESGGGPMSFFKKAD